MVSDESGYFQGLVEKLAYQLWEERGRPSGSSEQDWVRAEQVIRHHLGSSSPDGLALPALPAMSFEPSEERRPSS
jgi:hypothetical protein